jgi:hypothetical protein
MRHFKFRGLTPGATYVVAVRACGVGGWGRRAAMRLTTPGVTNVHTLIAFHENHKSRGLLYERVVVGILIVGYKPHIHE